MFLQLNSQPWSIGWCIFQDANPEDSNQTPKIVLRCQLTSLSFDFLAMIDTGAPWSILKPEIADLLNFPIDQNEEITLNTRLGRFKGTLQKIGIKLHEQKVKKL